MELDPVGVVEAAADDAADEAARLSAVAIKINY